METVLNVEGMSCQHCVKHVKESLVELEGVSNVSVSLEGKTATVEHSEEVVRDTLILAVTEAGYKIV